MPGPTRCRYAYRNLERPACQLNATVAYGTTGLCTSGKEQRSTLGKDQAGRQFPALDLLPSTYWSMPTPSSRRPPNN